MALTKTKHREREQAIPLSVHFLFNRVLLFLTRLRPTHSRRREGKGGTEATIG